MHYPHSTRCGSCGAYLILIQFSIELTEALSKATSGGRGVLAVRGCLFQERILSLSEVDQSKKYIIVTKKY